MKISLLKGFFLGLALSSSSGLFACTTNSDCVSDPGGPTCIGGICDSCCNAPVSNSGECADVADTCQWNEDYGTCQDNVNDLCPTEQIPESPLSSASRWLWLVLAGLIVGGATFWARRKKPSQS